MESRLSRVTVPLPESLRNAQRSWDERVLLRVALTEEGHTGYGEACPLPGYSPETNSVIFHAPPASASNATR